MAEGLVLRSLLVGLLQWRQPRRPVPAGTLAFYSFRTGMDYITTIVVAAVSVVEIPVVHLLVAHWHPGAARVVTGAGLLSTLYVVGLVKELRWRPVLVSADQIVLRGASIREWRVQRRAVGAVRKITGRSGGRNVVRAFLFDQPNICLSVDSQGIDPCPRSNCGLVDIELRVDDPDAFLRVCAPGNT